MVSPFFLTLVPLIFLFLSCAEMLRSERRQGDPGPGKSETTCQHQGKVLEIKFSSLITQMVKRNLREIQQFVKVSSWWQRAGQEPSSLAWSQLCAPQIWPSRYLASFKCIEIGSCFISIRKKSYIWNLSNLKEIARHSPEMVPTWFFRRDEPVY